jgi:hypothetical protein
VYVFSFLQLNIWKVLSFAGRFYCIITQQKYFFASLFFSIFESHLNFTNMEVQKAKIDDIDIIMNVFDAAKLFMRKTGNDKQWIDGYPSREIILNNIQDESFYVCLSEQQIVGVFFFKIGEEITYNKIYDGEWLNDKPYGVVHRIASNGTRSKISDFCLQWCIEKCKNIRIDTHRDNIVMQNVLKRNGYKQCGIIYLANGAERIAFQKSI